MGSNSKNVGANSIGGERGAIRLVTCFVYRHKGDVFNVVKPKLGQTISSGLRKEKGKIHL